ncbi:MAG: diacylglycerol kinase [Arcobacteraceae bacterium]|jgi:diacylglycerol kinase (ATP)|nr:diacylglycerol kinase [Arcobacteraceae bacterium]
MKNIRNQPKYNFFKNSTYALNGLKDIVQNESSFKIELILAFLLLPIVLVLDISTTYKLLMYLSFMAILVAEAINSAIERVVDLVTLEYHPMAKKAKDVGSAIVFLSIVNCIVVWLVCLIELLL